MAEEQPARQFETLLYEKEGSIAWVTLDRPEVLNAVNLQMRDDLWTIMEAFRDDPDALVLIIKGAGERAFSAGADISEFGTAPSYVESRRARRERDLWGLMLALEKPLIAAIHGHALGAGCEMSMCCDLRIASEDARFGLPEVNLGYIPSAGGTQLLPRTIPPGVAMSLILSADDIDAREALRLGLVNRVVPRDRLYSEAEALARQLLARPQQALRYAKEAVLRGLELPLAEGLALEGRLAALAVAERQGRAAT
ncbi:MAG: enoyl-CoA hydratase/isomerase family protein [Dehalococcoidia bacterium]